MTPECTEYIEFLQLYIQSKAKRARRIPLNAEENQSLIDFELIDGELEIDQILPLHQSGSSPDPVP